MTNDQADHLQATCQARFIGLCKSNLDKPAPMGIDLYVEGFWAGVEAQREMHLAETLSSAVDLDAARAEGLIR